MSPDAPVTHYMNWIPHAVDGGLSLAACRDHMRVLNIGHLPVIDGDAFVGVVSQRDLDLLHTIEGMDPGHTPVREFVRTQCCSVGLDATLLDAVRCMTNMRSDCCLIFDDSRVVGILTSTDAMFVLGELLGGPNAVEQTWRPSEMPARIADEHRLIGRLLSEIEALTAQMAPGDVEAEAALRARCRELHITLARHVQLEHAIVVPALRSVPGEGPALAERMLVEHDRQMRSMLQLLARTPLTPAPELTTMLASLIDALRSDMAHEEALLASRVPARPAQDRA